MTQYPTIWVAEEARCHRIPTQQNAALTVRAQKSPLTISGMKKMDPDGAFGHELSRLKRASWLPAYGIIALREMWPLTDLAYDVSPSSLQCIFEAKQGPMPTPSDGSAWGSRST